jgi:Subtilisin inhibitor-like
MRGTLLIAALAVVVGCGAGATAASSAAATSASAELRIAYWENGSKTGAARTWTLRCDPAGGTLGTLARERDACRRLAALKRPFAPPDPDLACTQQYGGPQQALITGTYQGRRVWVRLGLADGCQISRFKRLAFLIPAYS